MSWLAFAGLAALFESLKDLYGKRGLLRADPYVVAWSLRLFALPFLVPLLLLQGPPELDGAFWAALCVGGSLNVAANVLYMQAIQSSDLSLSVPLVSFTPLFLLLSSPLILGELPGPLGAAGIGFIVAGAYVLNLGQWRAGLLAPFRALLSRSGPRRMLLVAFLWSIASNVDKIGVQASSVVWWIASIQTYVAVGMVPLVLWRSKGVGGQVRTAWPELLAVGLCSALVLVFQMTALTLTLVAHVIAVKRSSVVLSVVWGRLVFGEAGFRERLAGAATMALGVALLALA